MPEDNANSVISRNLVTESAAETLAAVEEYWTEERLFEAQPIPVEAPPPPAEALAMFATEFAPDGEPEDQESEVPEPVASIDTLGLTGVAGSYDTARVPNRNVFPYTAVGKLFMTFDGANYVGSAWVIGQSAIFTAGHCIFDDGAEDGWADRVLFIPQYHQGQEPIGRWAATRLHTLSGWAAGGDDKFQYDMAAARLDRPVGPDTGVVGWIANQAPAPAYQSVGYPSRRLSNTYPFDGREMWRCNGAYLDGANPIKMANNMTEGCSGGPWLIERNGRFYANGLNSFRWNVEPETMNSPYFGRGFLNLLAAV